MPGRTRKGLGWIVVSGAAILSGCDGAPAGSAKPDRFHPQRPTETGSLSDAVREAGGRAGDRARQSVGALEVGAIPEAPAPIEVAPVVPEPLTIDVRRGVEEYLAALNEVNRSLSGVRGGAEPGASLGRVGPPVDRLRAALDAMIAVSAGQSLTIRDEYGPQLRELARQFRGHAERLRGEPACAPVVTLVEDVPLID